MSSQSEEGDRYPLSQSSRYDDRSTRRLNSQSGRIVSQRTCYPRDQEENNLATMYGGQVNQREEKTLRLYYNNCNCLEATRTISNAIKAKAQKNNKKFLGFSKQDSKLDGIMQRVLEWQANIICLAETGVDWNAKVAKRTFGKIVNVYDTRMCMTTSTANTSSTSYYKPGGTATLVDGIWSGSITKRGDDPHGMERWSYVTLTGKKDTRLTIITAYRN